MLNPHTRDLPTPFQLFRYITGSEHLHFGLFESLEEPIANAQERMMSRLLDLFPTQVAQVLDVGCGIGGTSVTLAQRDLRVVGFAPDEGLMTYARLLAKESGVAERTRFHAQGLFEFEPTEGDCFDVVISQESLQYIHPLEQTMACLRQRVRPGGRLIIGDQVLRDPRGKSMVQFHSSEDILALAQSNGFSLLSHDDITEQASLTPAVSVAKLVSEGPAILEYFGDPTGSLKHDLEVCIRNGKEEYEAYQNGQIGYELFSFE